MIYTVSGGTKAVSVTQKQQMTVMMGGMILAGIIVVQMIPVSFTEALHVAGKMDKLNIVNFEFDLSDRYNFWSGFTGALFLFLSYFGTDQSQVQRYLSGKTLTESRMGLMMNGFLKVPMQFIILFIGVMVFVFYQFYQPPVFFNTIQLDKLKESEYLHDFNDLEQTYTNIFESKGESINGLLGAIENEDQEAIDQYKSAISDHTKAQEDVRDQVKELIVKNDPLAETRDTDYVFMRFVMDYLPQGVIGLLFAVIFSAAMSSTASELNALSSTTTIDIYRRSINKEQSSNHYMKSSRWFTVLWGVFAILFATYATLFENLIQAVNLLGSLFYGSILGIFMVAFFMKWVGGKAVFLAAIVTEILILTLHYYNGKTIGDLSIDIGFLWYNAIGCLLVMAISALLSLFIPKPKKPTVSKG